MRPHNLSLLLVIALLLGVAACQTYQHEQSPAPSWNPPPLASPIIKSQQQLIVPPAVPGLRHYRLGIPLFRTPASVPEAGYPVTKIFYRQILEKGLFREVVFIERGFADLNEAISMGHEFKVDLMLLGAIPYFLDSGGAGKSGIQVDLQLREVKSRHIFWYLTDAITAAQRPIPPPAFIPWRTPWPNAWCKDSNRQLLSPRTRQSVASSR
jgi:hypothetical protein